MITKLYQQDNRHLPNENKCGTKSPSAAHCLRRGNNLKVDHMAQNSLRLVEEKSVDKSKALDAALSQIERAFGKGSIMQLGSNENVVEIETVSRLVLSAWILRLVLAACRKAALSKFTVLKAPARRRWRCRQLPKPRRRAAFAPLSMLNMRLIRSMPASWVSISKIF